MKFKSQCLYVGSTNIMHFLEEDCFIPLPRVRLRQGWVSDYWVVTST